MLGFPPMNKSTTGLVHGDHIALDAPVPDLEGRRVRIVLEPVEDVEHAIDPGEQRQLWQEWMKTGPHGPIEDADGPDFPRSDVVTSGGSDSAHPTNAGQ